MEVEFNAVDYIDRMVRTVAGRLEELSGLDFDPQVRPADPRFGDFQVNGVLPLAKALKTNPRALGQKLLDAILAAPEFASGFEEITLAGPGFVNFRLSPAFQAAWMAAYDTAARLREGARHLAPGRKVVVDYSSPNTAKEMHVGHIRSTVIGETIARLLSFAGSEVIRDNHIGDWGTQFGMLIFAIKESGYDLDNPGPNALAELEELYKKGNEKYKEGGEAADRIRMELVGLQQGDPENKRIWERITAISRDAFQQIYDALGIRFDMVLGESFYRDKVEEIYRDLLRSGIAVEDQGALVVFHPEHPRFAKQPFIVRKADGASNYASTDLATVRYRTDELGVNEMIYVVDSRQGDHFEQLFLTVKKLHAALGKPVPAMTHVAFGKMLGDDGRPIKTKEGGSVKLKALLEEAVERSFRVVSEKNPELPEEERLEVARVVGHGAVRYVDLSQNRSTDYIFSWDKMLSFEGNTAPYLLYAVARIHSIFRKAEISVGDFQWSGTIDEWESDTERDLARHLMQFPMAINQALSDFRPHFLCSYLYELAGYFSTFYNANRVLVDDPGVRQRRLLFCHRTLLLLETGLNLLGLETLERM